MGRAGESTVHIWLRVCWHFFTARREKVSFFNGITSGILTTPQSRATSPGVVGQLQLDLIGPVSSSVCMDLGPFLFLLVLHMPLELFQTRLTTREQLKRPHKVHPPSVNQTQIKKKVETH